MNKKSSGYMASQASGVAGAFTKASDSKKNASRKFSGSKKRSSLFDEGSSDDGLDDDGNPVTVQAA